MIVKYDSMVRSDKLESLHSQLNDINHLLYKGKMEASRGQNPYSIKDNNLKVVNMIDVRKCQYMRAVITQELDSRLRNGEKLL